MASNKAKVGAALSFILGFVAMTILLGPVSAGEECLAIAQECAGNIVCVLRSGLPNVASSLQGVASTALLISIYFPMMIRIILEMNPLAAGLLLVLGQIIGSANMFPLTFVPIHALGWGRRNSGGPRASGLAALVAAILLLASVVNIFASGGSVFSADLFNFYLLVPAVVVPWYLLSEERAPIQVSPSQSFWLTSMLAMTSWLTALIIYFNVGGPDLTDCQSNFLLGEFVVLYAAMLAHLYLCDANPRLIGQALIMGPFLSPGVAFAHAFNSLEEIEAKISPDSTADSSEA